MPGQTIRLAGITEFNFNDVGASGEVTQLVAQHVDVSSWTQAIIMVRAHSLDIAQSGASIKVQVVADGYTDLEPQTQFLDTSAFLAEVSIIDTDTAPMFRTKELTSGSMGSMVTVSVGGIQAAQTGNLNAVLSIDLVLKS